MKMLTKTFSIFLLVFIAIGSNSNAFGWSWKDLKVGVTTEEEVLNLGGKPYQVILSIDDYLRLQTGRLRDHPLVEFKYKVDTISLKYMSEKEWKIPAILEKAPLSLSDEIWGIEMSIYFSNGKLRNFRYKFEFKSKPDRKQCIDLLSSLLGSPITIGEGDFGIRSTHVEYKNGYRVMFMEGYRESDSISLFLPHP